MTPQESEMIADLFRRLRTADTAPKDPEAEALIRRLVTEHASAPYLLTQTALIQEHALTTAQGRMDELQRQLAQTQAQLEAAQTQLAQAQAAQAPARPASPGGFLGGVRPLGRRSATTWTLGRTGSATRPLGRSQRRRGRRVPALGHGHGGRSRRRGSTVRGD